MVTVLEGIRRTKASLKATPQLDDVYAQVTPHEPVEDILSEILLTPPDSPQLLCETKLLTVATLRLMDTSGPKVLLAKAMTLHSCLLELLPLSSRRLENLQPSPLVQDFLTNFALTACKVLRDPKWLLHIERVKAACNLADLIDGRMFVKCVDLLSSHEYLDFLDDQSRGNYEHLLSLVQLESWSDSGFACDSLRSKHGSPPNLDSLQIEELSLMPFSNSVFDTHLSSIEVSVDEAAIDERRNPNKLFRDDSHWHVAKPLQQKSVLAAKNAKLKERALKRNQTFMRDMVTYSASLTNAVGKILEPETIITRKNADTLKNGQKAEKVAAKENAPSFSGSNPLKQASAGAKNKQKGSRKAQMFEDIAHRNTQKKSDEAGKAFDRWRSQIQSLELIGSDEIRYERTLKYLHGLPKDQQALVGAEVQLFALHILLKIWQKRQKHVEEKDILSMNAAALMWNHLNHIRQGPVNPTVHICVKVASEILGFAPPEDESTLPNRKLSFDFSLPGLKGRDATATKDPKTFQIAQCGPYLDRSMDSAADDRVRFAPDAWQRKVLDLIDERKSVFIAAPTSAGKTFISFYAMKQILATSDNDVLIYVAPTKALVNQIAAEIQANFKKTYPQAGTSVWAIHTRDYRINNSTGCQILVTVPHVLQILLLSPSNASSWSPRVKRIIFDEIHCIGQAEDGLVWEQLLLLAPCPIIALSATVGNPTEFSDWLSSTQSSMGLDLQMIRHPHRYSDLRKYIFNPPQEYQFFGLSGSSTLGNLGLDMDSSFVLIHPVATLQNRARGMPEDLNLESRDCLTLWQCMKRHETTSFQVDSSLDPRNLPSSIRKIHVIDWEMRLKETLQKWMTDRSSPFGAVVEELSRPLQGLSIHRNIKTGDAETQTTMQHNTDSLLSTTLPLAARLHAQGALPAIFFNYERSTCEKMGLQLLKQLKAAEVEHKSTSASFKKKVADWEEWKVQQAKTSKKPAKITKGANNSEEKSKLEQERENAEIESDPMLSFDPEAPLPEYSFANHKVLQPSEFAEYTRKLQWANIAPYLRDALTRGIGIHHAGMNRLYRQCVEMLFRKGFLRIVIATGTLSLGINMPCKTVVFSGDSVFLTALNFRQAAGRAGRRGFDLLGNVVFQNIPQEKVCRLISSRLPNLQGHFPITTSLVLRMFVLLKESNDSQYAKKAINSLLAQPRLYLGGTQFRDGVLHHLRFSIEYLRRQGLLDASGTPLNFAGCVAHLYFTENSSFAFHALLMRGYFHKATRNFNSNNEDRVLDSLMLVMAHLFGRRSCRPVELEKEYYAKRIYRSSSIVYLPDLPSGAKDVLDQHNKQTLQIFVAYIKTFAEQHLRDQPDNRLPMTGEAWSPSRQSSQALSEQSLTKLERTLGIQPSPTIRSAFAALSGHSDVNFSSISNLCHTVRSQVFLEESAIPHLPLDKHLPLNAWLYDFYKHGDVETLERANGVRKGDVWFLLNDFSLILATIVTSLKNFLGFSDGTDADMIDLQGGGDEADEEAVLQNLTSLEADPVVSAGATGRPATSMQKPKQGKKAVVAESWDDEDGESSARSPDRETDLWSRGRSSTATPGSGVESRTSMTSEVPSTISWDNVSASEDGGGLLHVLKAFERLRVTFDGKFKAMWA